MNFIFDYSYLLIFIHFKIKIGTFQAKFHFVFQTFPSIVWPESFFKFHDITNAIVNKRIESKDHFGDFVDKIIEVCNDANSPLSKDMIMSQGAIFFLAGFETTSNCLTTLCYSK